MADIHIHVDDRLVAGFRRMFNRRGLAVVAALAVVGVGVAHAEFVDPEPTFTPGTVISSSSVNAKFVALFAAVNTLSPDTVLTPPACDPTDCSL